MYRHLDQMLRDRAAVLPDATAVSGQEGFAWKSVPWRELVRLVGFTAADLAGLGVGAGDRVVLWLPNAWRTPIYLFALWQLGAVAVPFDREMNPDAARQIIDSVDARLILVGTGEQPPWAQGRALVEWWEPGTRPAAPAIVPAEPRAADELAIISFTSGTTGQPKGCMLTHANLCFQIEALVASIPLGSDCRLASILPLSHVFELACGLLYPLRHGASVHYIPSRRPPDILRVLREQRITHMLVVPQLLSLMGAALVRKLEERLTVRGCRALLSIAPRLPVSLRRRLFWPVHRQLGGHLRLMGSGGAALSVEAQDLWDRLGVRVVQGYGASETSAVIAAARHDGSTPWGSVGKALPGVEVRITPEGEALVRGGNVMRGYWRDPERTGEVLRDGWFATGDLVRQDDAGNLWVVGRSKDLIVLPSGMKVWPQDIEAVLREQPGVNDAAVMSVATAAGGARLHAYLLPATADQRSANPRELIAECNGHLALHQRLATASWWVGEDFPRTAMGKVRRHLLPLPSDELVVTVATVDAADDPIGQAIRGVARATGVTDSQTLAEIGLDSFGLVDLALALEEKTGRAFSDGDLRTEMTVGEVRAFVRAAPELVAGQTATDGHHTAENRFAVPMWPYTWGRAFRWLRFPISWLYAGAITHTSIVGAEYLAHLPERIILAGTHHGFADVPLVYHALARAPARGLTRRLVAATMATGFFNFPLQSRWLALAYGLYPLRQLGERDTSMRELVHLAELGNAILIFPQGWHVPPELEVSDDPRAHFRPGVAYLAATLAAPVVPFGLAGTEAIVPPRMDEFHGRVIGGIAIALHRGPLAIAFGPPLRKGEDESIAAFTKRVETACLALAESARLSLAMHQDLNRPAPPWLAPAPPDGDRSRPHLR
ncbi:MAG: AMP-binding protein [Chloroflexi bacterium]|nr:AMP-binding protein [Chloroflexota bacterium]